MKTFVLPDGRRLAYRESGSGPVLVMLHGWSMSSAVFSEAIAAFSSSFRVLAPDLRGHGESEPGPGYRLADLAGDVATWMEKTVEGEVSLLGWSLGGQVALHLAMALREKVGRIILQSTTPRFVAGNGWSAGLPVGQVRAMKRDLDRNYQKAMGDFFSRQFEEGEMSRERFWRVVDFAVRAGRLPLEAVALETLDTLSQVDLRAGLAQIDVPVLVVHGEMDRIIPFAAGAYLAQQLPLARLAALPGAGHAPFLSSPEDVFALWREFLP